jgi:hypothetical protein
MSRNERFERLRAIWACRTYRLEVRTHELYIRFIIRLKGYLTHPGFLLFKALFGAVLLANYRVIL